MNGATSSDGDHGSRGAAPTAVSAPEMKPSAGATSVNGRARSTYAREVRGAACGCDVVDHASASATAAATAVLMKLSMSLFRIPGPSSVAPSALSTSAPAVAPATTMTMADAGIRPSAAPTAASANAASSPAAVPSSDIAPGVPGFTRRSVVTRNVDRPQALPISLATVSLPPAVSAATSASSAAGAYGVVDRGDRGDRRDAAVGDRVAGAAAAAALLGDAELFLALQARAAT